MKWLDEWLLVPKAVLSKHGLFAMCYVTLKFFFLVNINILAIFLLFRLMEEAYVMKDPFSEERGFITLGSNCSICRAKVCLSQVLKIKTFFFS